MPSFPIIPGWSQFVGLIAGGLEGLFSVTGNAGLAIIFFTIFVKIALVPLSLPALRNSRRQQELSPLIREIQKRHKGDRAAASAEQMELYRQYGFNPLAGCLPTLVQIPVFFALWQAILRLGQSEAGQSGFLWLTQISRPDPIHLLPFLAAAAQFLQTRMAIQPKAQVVDAQQKQMNLMMQFMPLMVIVFGWNIAAGAVLYWFVSSLFSAAQQWFVTGWGSLRDLIPFLPQRRLKSLLPAPKPEGYTKPSGKAGFMQRMQEKMLEAQQQAEAQRRGETAPGAAAVPAQEKSDAPTEAETPVALVAESDEGVRFTDDAWRLPGAAGSVRSATVVQRPVTVARPTSGAQNARRSNNRSRRRNNGK